MMKTIETPDQIFSLSIGDRVSKRNLFDVVQYSKVEHSEYWGGEEYIIGNTPQQGINWIGNLPYLKGVIIKAYHGAYEEDGWENEQHTSFRYSFKARKGKINLSETANNVLIKQPQYDYPILLFLEDGNSWRNEGAFCVSRIEESYVILEAFSMRSSNVDLSQDELVFQEGNRKYVTHLITERSKSAVALLKSTSQWICDICGHSYSDRYGIEYIEAHHKVPISDFEEAHAVQTKDFALLCPNCHKAVHIYMKLKGDDYETIKNIIRGYAYRCSTVVKYQNLKIIKIDPGKG